MSVATADWSLLAPGGDDESDPLGSAAGGCSRAATLAEIAGIVVSPDDRSPLRQVGDAFVGSSGANFPIRNGRPVLLPRRAVACLVGDLLEIPFAALSDPLLQYLYLGQVKNAGGAVNSPSSDIWYRRHMHRAARLVADARGLVLDIGCDDPQLSRGFFPPAATYVGLEPSLGERSEPCLVGMAEFLPLADASVDAVAFMTSLDHVLDYHTAIDEAFRVLRPGGRLYLATLIWTDRAGLTTDRIHFHHFRQFEIEGVLRKFRIDSVTRYGWKGDTHRFGVYIGATKPDRQR